MLKRTFFISNPYHLSIKNDQIVLKCKETNKTSSSPIEDLGFLILDHQQITFSQSVIQAMSANNVAVIFCDKKHHPTAMTLSFEGNHVQTEIIRHQINLKKPESKKLWQQTIQSKIANQAALLGKLGKEFRPMKVYKDNVKSGDTSNQESAAARFYWKNLFGKGKFKRSRSGEPPNNALNYGYAVLRAAVARALVGSGLLPSLGIHHHNKYNAYCLADDIMEPYRPFVDEIVYDLFMEKEICKELNKGIKAKLLGLLNVDVGFEKIRRPLMVGLSLTTSSLSKCISKHEKRISYPKLI